MRISVSTDSGPFSSVFIEFLSEELENTWLYDPQFCLTSSHSESCYKTLPKMVKCLYLP